MSRDAQVTIVGNLGKDPAEAIRFTGTGKAVANISIGVTSLQGKDKESLTTWYECTLWEQMAVNAADSLNKGDRVIVTGELSSREYTPEGGEKRVISTINVREIGPSMRWATVSVTRNPRDEAPAQGAAQASQPANAEEPF